MASSFAARDCVLDTFDDFLTVCSLVDFTSETVIKLAKERSNDPALAGSTAMSSAGICRGASCCPSRCRTASCQANTRELVKDMTVEKGK